MRRRPLLALALVVFVTMPLASRAVAQQTDKQRQLAHDIEETGKAAQQARAAAVKLQSQRAEFDARLADLQAQVVAAEAGLAAAQVEVDRLEFASLLLSIDIDDTQQRLALAEADTKKSALLLYKHPDSSSMLGLMENGGGSGALVEGKHYLQRVSEKRRDDLARSVRLREELVAQQGLLDKQKQQASDARAEAEATKNQIAGLFAQQQAARDGAAQAQQGYEVQVAALAAQQIGLEAEKAAEDARIRALLESVGSGPPMGNGQLLRPVGGTITSGFGNRTDPMTGNSAFHAGIDFGASCGTPIKAAGNAVVVSAGPQGGYGNATILNHGGGMATLYGHQSSIAVSAGESVTAGQVIGYVGNTGKSTGCHLHFEVRINGNPVNPSQYL